MKLLIVAATDGEIAPLLHHLNQNAYANVPDILITGVGMVATTYTLLKRLQTKQYDLVLQAGVAGSFNRDIALGEVVFVVWDQFADLGAEDHEHYQDVFELGLEQRGQPPYEQGRLVNPTGPAIDTVLRTATGLTVNTVSGSLKTIAMRTAKFDADVESMEGAALHYVCLREGMPFAQVRAISNYVIPRDKSSWRMKDAIINLNKWLIAYIDGLQ